MKSYIKRFSQNSGPMAQNSIDYYKNEMGHIIMHEWGMGGETKTYPSCVPEHIEGYEEIKIPVDD